VSALSLNVGLWELEGVGLSDKVAVRVSDLLVDIIGELDRLVDATSFEIEDETEREIARE
jgi:hypothetical protein